MRDQATADVFSVARYIRERAGNVDSWKLQKLAYYVQAWSLVWRGRPAFVERIEAWTDGPVCPSLRSDQLQNGARLRSAAPLGADDRAHVDRVLEAYGAMLSRDLVDLTHDERPWREARGDLPADARSTAEITHASMASYYGEQWAEAEADRASLAQPGWTGTADELDAMIAKMDD